MKPSFKSFFFALLPLSLSAEDLFLDKLVPIIENNCIRCHHPDHAEGKLSLATKADWLKGGREGAVAVPHQAETSLITYVITPEDQNTPPEMPEEAEPLVEADVQVIKDWIQAGMPWKEGYVIEQKSKADKSFWSLQAIKNHPIPKTSKKYPDWNKNIIDRFVLASLESQQLSLSKKTHKRNLIRRATFDLHGLPPPQKWSRLF